MSVHCQGSVVAPLRCTPRSLRWRHPGELPLAPPVVSYSRVLEDEPTLSLTQPAQYRFYSGHNMCPARYDGVVPAGSIDRS